MRAVGVVTEVAVDNLDLEPSNGLLFLGPDWSSDALRVGRFDAFVLVVARDCDFACFKVFVD